MTLMLQLVLSTSLLAGFATPVAAPLIVAISLLFGGCGLLEAWLPFIGAGVSLMMLGPGAWSVDAQIFGRKRLLLENADSSKGGRG